MRALADADQRRGRRIGHLPDRIDPHTRGVEHAVRAQREALAAFLILRGQRGPPLRVETKIGAADIVDRHRAQRDRGLHQRDAHQRIVELTVPVRHAAEQPVAADAGQAGEGFIARQPVRGAQAGRSGQLVVQAQADPQLDLLDTAVAGHDELERRGHVRRVAQQGGTLGQCLAHQLDVALRQIANAAVDQLGATARGAACKVAAVDQRHAQAALRGINGNAEAGRTAADDHGIPRLRIAQLREQPLAVDRCRDRRRRLAGGACHSIQCDARSTARLH